MSEFEQWYEQEIGSENKPEYEAAKWAWEYQQKKLDCCRDENKAHLEKIDAVIKTVDWHIEDCGIGEETEYNKAWLEAMLFVKQELLK